MSSSHELQGATQALAPVTEGDLYLQNDLQRAERVIGGYATEMHGLELEAIIHGILKKFDVDRHKLDGLTIRGINPNLSNGLFLFADPVTIKNFKRKEGTVRCGVFRAAYKVTEHMVLPGSGPDNMETFMPKILQTIAVRPRFRAETFRKAEDTATLAEAEASLRHVKAIYDDPSSSTGVYRVTDLSRALGKS